MKAHPGEEKYSKTTTEYSNMTWLFIEFVYWTCPSGNQTLCKYPCMDYGLEGLLFLGLAWDLKSKYHRGPTREAKSEQLPISLVFLHSLIVSHLRQWWMPECYQQGEKKSASNFTRECPRETGTVKPPSICPLVCLLYLAENLITSHALPCVYVDVQFVSTAHVHTLFLCEQLMS